MGLGSELNPGYLIADIHLLGKDNKSEKVVMVEKLASIENVEHIEDAVDIDGGRGRCLGDNRLSLAPSMVAYGGTRQESRGGREETHLQHTRWW